MGRRMFAVLGGFLLSMVVGCGESSLDRQSTVIDAGTPDVGPPTCACIDLSTVITSSNGSLCGCTMIEFGCQDDPQLYRGPCDVRPGCYYTTVDPMTGCEMPATESNLTGCSCLGVDGGT